MRQTLDHQFLSTTWTTWHVTWGTYAARLHGDDRPTVDRNNNRHGDPFVNPDLFRAWVANDSLRGKIVLLTLEQQLLVQELIPQLCLRGAWSLRTCAAARDHVHVVLDVDPTIHGERVRRLLKRWVGEALTAQFGKPAGGTWWAKEGSNKAIHDDQYLNNACRYVCGQRAKPGREGG